VYFLCRNANKIYLDTLYRRYSVLLPSIAENDCECKMTVENDCPESFRFYESYVDQHRCIVLQSGVKG
jgi:hypothetical protein